MEESMPSALVLPADVGTRVVALRQLEAVVAQMVSSWLDGSMTNEELWDFLRSNLLKHAVPFADVIAATNPAVSVEQVIAGPRERSQAICHCVQWLSDADPAIYDFGSTVVTALLAVMVIRQWEDALNQSQAIAPPAFQLSSNHVAEQFLANSLEKLEWTPFGIDEPQSLEALADRVARETEGELQLARVGAIGLRQAFR